MRRLARILFASVAAASFWLGAAAVGLWVRSYSVADEVRWGAGERCWRHVLRMSDSLTNKRTRPGGAAKVILYRKVVATGSPAPTGLAEMEQVNAYTASKIVLTYDGALNGKTVRYGACCANGKNENGSTRTIVAATIAA